MSKLKILIVSTPEGSIYQQIMLDHFANNGLFDVVVIPPEEYYNVGTPGHIDHGKSRIGDDHGLGIDNFFYDKMLEVQQILNEKELPANYMPELRNHDPLPIIDVTKPNKPWYRQGEKSW